MLSQFFSQRGLPDLNREQSMLWVAEIPSRMETID
jgi:hypothetical protein